MKPSPIKETDPQTSMSDDNSQDSLKTKHKKADWMVAKIVEHICHTQGFNTSINASPITTWVNPIRILLKSDYVPHLTYSEPPSMAC